MKKCRDILVSACDVEALYNIDIMYTDCLQTLMLRLLLAEILLAIAMAIDTTQASHEHECSIKYYAATGRRPCSWPACIPRS